MNRYSRRITVWLFLAPALAFYLAFVVAPILQSFVVSLFDWPTLAARPTRFVGLDNYARLVTDEIFWKALSHNVILLVLSLVIQLPLALFLAALLSGRVVARGFFRTVYFTPMILPSVVIALVWEQMYLPAIGDGLIVKLLDSLGLPSPENGFLGDPRLALPAVILTISWRYVAFHMVLFMAGIETISEELYEAARIDGASSWQLFRYITLPSLAPVIRISAVLSIVGSLKYFDLVYVMTRGGPPEHVTELMTTYMYKIGIDQYNGGYGSAVAVGGFLVSVLVVAAVMGMRWHMRTSVAEARP
jgi:raffinose/stachyose/melibiose transport system permease protein